MDASKVVQLLKKEFGDEIGDVGVKTLPRERIPFGILDLDIATGGGIPRNEMTMIYGPESCLAGDTFVQYAVHVDGKRANHKGGSIERLYHRFNGIPHPGKGSYQRPGTVDAEFTVPCVNDEGRVFHNKVKRVVKTGTKECLRIRTSSGETIEATREHKFHVGSGYVRAGDLAVGDTVSIHNSTPYRVDEPYWRNHAPRPRVYVKHHPFGCEVLLEGGRYRYKMLPRSRFLFEAHINGMEPEEFKAALNDGYAEGSLQFLDPTTHVHHLDENYLNDDLDNLVALMSEEHGRTHARERHNNLRFTMVPTTIEAIEKVGLRDTYDLEVEAPHNNYVANGFVVHNSCKTNLALSLIREHQKRWPDKTCAFIDVEGTGDRDWMRMLGVDVDKLVYVRPDFAEQAIDASEKLTGADDMGIVVIDSIAAMATIQEMERDPDQETPGTRGRAVSKLVTRSTSALTKAKKAGRGSTLVWINQVREKIGGYGNPESLPGGQAQKFMAMMRIRVSKRSKKEKEIVKEIHSTLPTWKIVRANIEKFKVAVCERETMLALCMIPHKGLRAGQANDWPGAKRYMQEMGLWEKKGSKYIVMGHEFATTNEAREWFVSDPAIVDDFVRMVVESKNPIKPKLEDQQ